MWAVAGVSLEVTTGDEKKQDRNGKHTPQSPPKQAYLLQRSRPSVTDGSRCPGLAAFSFWIFQDKRKPSRGEWLMLAEAKER